MNYIAKKIALQEKNILNHADLYLDYNNRIAFHKNRKINLTVKEFDILFFLASYPGQVFTHRQIYETVWGKEYFCDEGNVTAHIGHIRKKIELDPRNPVFIQTVRGIGYKFATMSNAFFELIFKQSNQQDLNSLYAIQVLLFFLCFITIQYK